MILADISIKARSAIKVGKCDIVWYVYFVSTSFRFMLVYCTQRTIGSPFVFRIYDIYFEKKLRGHCTKLNFSCKKYPSYSIFLYICRRIGSESVVNGRRLKGNRV
jgi:hypothetical protein